MQYNALYNCVLSADTSGMIEYWEPEAPFELPKNLAFEYKADTDLFEFKKVREFGYWLYMYRGPESSVQIYSLAFSRLKANISFVILFQQSKISCSTTYTCFL